MMLKVVAGLLVVVVAAGCTELTGLYGVRDSFNMSYAEYNRMVRWGDSAQGCGNYAQPPIIEECRRKLSETKATIVDLRVKSVDYDPNRPEATVWTEIDYYILPSTQVKTVEDIQQWVYAEGEGKKRVWRLATAPPRFR